MIVWIPGGIGLVGTEVRRLLLQMKVGYISTSHTDVDISSYSQVSQFLMRHHTVTHIINCAALTDVDRAERDPQAAFMANAQGPEILARAANDRALRLTHISTDYVFNGSDETPFHEDSEEMAPINVYGASKYEGEQRVRKACPSACIIRTSWVFGGHSSGLIPKLAKILTQTKTTCIEVAYDQKNRLTYAPDLAQVIWALRDHSGIYHFANQGVVSRFEIACELQRCFPSKHHEIIPVPVSHFTLSAPRPMFSVLGTSKIEATEIQVRSWKAVLSRYATTL